MKYLNVGVDSWIIQDGNYGDFNTGQKIEFALEFYPISLNRSNCNENKFVNIEWNRYKICGQVVFVSKNVWVIDCGILVYQNVNPPKFVSKGMFVEGEIYFGIDPFMYFEGLKNLKGMPDLTYNFIIEQIFLETTPWIKRLPNDSEPISKITNREILVRDKENESFSEVAETDAWNDDSGHGAYILRCLFYK